MLEGKHAVRPRKPAIPPGAKLDKMLLNLGQKVLDPSIENQFQRPNKPFHVRGLVEKID